MKESPFPPIPPAPADPSIPWQEAAVVNRCEDSGGHIVKPAKWPPTMSARVTEPPSLSIQCERCEAWLIVYDRPMPGIQVIKPQGAMGLVTK